MEIKQASLIEEGLSKCLHLDKNKVCSNETMTATLKALTQIAFEFPKEISTHVVQRAI
jgi:hypothetical protein